MAGAIAARPSSTLRLFESWPQLFGESKNALFHTDPELLRTEVEISPRGDDGCRSHKAVLRRRAGEHDLCALVYDNPPEGTYTLWLDDVARARDVRVESGAVVELDWRRSAAEPAFA